MAKADLLKAIKEKSGTDLTTAKVEEMFDAVFDTIASELESGNKVDIRGFGVFSVKDQKARTARNPRTGEAIEVPAKKAPAFKAGKGLKDQVNT